MSFNPIDKSFETEDQGLGTTALKTCVHICMKIEEKLCTDSISDKYIFPIFHSSASQLIIRRRSAEFEQLIKVNYFCNQS